MAAKRSVSARLRDRWVIGTVAALIVLAMIGPFALPFLASLAAGL
ncbi:hypothetical protein [Antribacter soli]|nr:hypothetical protein [Antribacter soli]